MPIRINLIYTKKPREVATEKTKENKKTKKKVDKKKKVINKK